MGITTAICTLTISFVGLVASIYYSNRNAKRNSDMDIEKEIQKAKEEARRDQTINMKLDNVLLTMDTIKRELSAVSSDNARLDREIEIVKQRIDLVEKVVYKELSN
jgi:septal ring factor EnvC (AmiA/AmiB activator)